MSPLVLDPGVRLGFAVRVCGSGLRFGFAVRVCGWCVRVKPLVESWSRESVVGLRPGRVEVENGVAYTAERTS